MRHFIENWSDNGFNNLRYTIVDCMNNADSLTADEIDVFLLEKEKSWIGTLVNQHLDLNSKHSLNRKKQCEHEQLIITYRQQLHVQ